MRLLGSLDSIQVWSDQLSDDFLKMLLGMDDTPVIREKDCRRAPFAYIGGKMKSAEFIHPHLPYRDGYAEPFGGTGVILLQREPSKLEIFNDRFAGVTCFYRVLRDPKRVEQLMDRLALIVHSREEFEWCNQTWEGCEDELERAARWWYQHQASFAKKANAFGRSTSGTNSTGRALRGNLQWFEPVHRRLHGVIIENLDWKQLLEDYDSPEMVWYMDPPYVSCTKNLYSHEFTRQDHLDLCDRIFELKGFVALSGYGDPATKDIYDRYDWSSIEEWDSSNLMAGYAFTESNNLAGKEHLLNRGTTKENLWIKEAV